MTRCLVCLLMLLLSASAASAATAVEWADLKDPASASFDDPFAALSVYELRSLGTVLRLRLKLEEKDVSSEARAGIEQRLRSEEARLVAAGVDVDGLLSKRLEIARKRTAAALAGNPAVAGREVAITGYVIPVVGPHGRATTGYLVPGAGMCSHMPAPDPNQMIRYSLKTDWEADYIYEPVQLIGTLSLETTSQEITLLDGQVDMLASFQMDVTEARSLDRGTRPEPRNRLFNLFRGRQADDAAPGQ
ncbi:DUF3299 domain-containing protein [Labrenzia sp. VG12]|uniref:DUF3299 domain-containing protein n=1 Tax=Labrenzia sp. VG12 TaxID=2021862 RepID=UPI0012FD506D|nr:DUF3299 domain-containing protein [Labrenzia sp. VG12]